MLRRLSMFSGLALLAISAIGGCGPKVPAGKIARTVAAAGTLRYQGKPLAFHQVSFIPDKQPSAIAVTDQEGHFVLGTNRPGDGAVPGAHQVAIVYVGNPEDDPNSKGLANVSTPPPLPPITIDAKYTKIETSGITVEVPAAGNKDIDIDLK